MKQLETKYPQAWVTRKKNRLKQYGDKVYLNGGEEFEIEIFNPTKNTVLAKIFIDNTLISSSGLVIKPGQRVYLERYLDVNKKFLFDTYLVDGSEEAQEAIEDNGNIEVRFFNEMNKSLKIYPVTYTNFERNFSSGGTNPYIFYNQTSISRSVASTDSLSFSNFSSEVETGRVEKGSDSGQDFVYIDKEFYMHSFVNSKWKILPLSTKPIEASEIRNYCTECGAKIKKTSWKFCPNCGGKV